MEKCNTPFSFVEMLPELGIQMTEAKAKSYFKMCDQDASGEIGLSLGLGLGLGLGLFLKSPNPNPNPNIVTRDG